MTRKMFEGQDAGQDAGQDGENRAVGGEDLGSNSQENQSEGLGAGENGENLGTDTFSRAYVEDLRKENASWRTRLRDAEARLAALAEEGKGGDSQGSGQDSGQDVGVDSQNSGQEDGQDVGVDSQEDGAGEVVRRLAALEAQLAERDAAVVRAQGEARLMRLAAQVGLDVEVAGLVDLGKLPEGDEEAVAVLQKLAPSGAVARGRGAANPGRQDAGADSVESLRERFWGSGGRSTIFGG